MSKPGDWISNDGARAQFLRLTQDTGIFLEHRLAELARDFAASSTHKRGVRVRAESLTYGSETEESPLRQIDQQVKFYKEFVLDERTGIQLSINVPVEAKYRRDIETCAVAYPSGSYRPALPLVSFLQGSDLGATLRSIDLFSTYGLSQPVFIEVEKGSTPKKAYGENLVFNAASALYDFIHFDCEENDMKPFGRDFVEKAKLIERFETYLSEKRYPWWSVIRKWMNENLTSALALEFNRQYLPKRVFFPVSMYVPVLFVNGPIREFVHDAGGETPDFRSCDGIITRVRVPRWPARLRRNLLGYTAEAPLVITNETGLEKCLSACLGGVAAVEAQLKKARGKYAQRWPLEAAFYQTALNWFLDSEESALRSDLDIFQWLHPLPPD